MNHDTSARSGVSRRTLLAGAAWSVPAVLVVGATPAFALSPGRLIALQTFTVERAQDAVIRFNFQVQNPNSHDVITLTSVSVDPPTTPTTNYTFPDGTGINPGQTREIEFTQTFGNNAATINTVQFSFTILYSIATAGAATTNHVSSEYTIGSGAVGKGETWNWTTPTVGGLTYSQGTQVA